MKRWQNYGSLLLGSIAYDFSAGHSTCGSILNQKSSQNQVKLKDGLQNTSGISKKHAYSDIWVLSQEMPKPELSRNKGQIPWLYARSQPNWQELSRRQGVLPRKGVWQALLHSSSVLKAHRPGIWYCFPLEAIISQFTISV